MLTLWLKAFHVFMILSWMAAVFYLPRLLVNLAEAHAAGEPTARLEGMAVRLFRFGAWLGVIGFALGFITWWDQGDTGNWIYWKLYLVAGLVAHYLIGGFYVYRMRRGIYTRGSIFFRIFNEMAVFIALPIVVLAVAKIG